MQASLDEFIRQEKEMRPSEALTERIMQSIGETEKLAYRTERRLQTFAIAASITLALVLGISLGKSYRHPDSGTWNIDDSRLENLALYEDLNE